MELNTGSIKDLERILQARAIEKYGEEISFEECEAFWHSDDVVQWFQAKGYTLYKLSTGSEYDPGTTSPSLPFDLFSEFNYPYAYHNAQMEGGGEPSLRAHDSTRRIVYAQDSQGRHVVIKLTHVATEECRILRFLHKQGVEVLRQNCILPILDEIQYQNACFFVTPRWGTNADQPECHTLRDILDMMRSMLKAVTFLHSHNIIHRDISLYNMLVNHFGDELEPRAYWPMRHPQLKAGKLCYVLMDFDLSIMMPGEVKKQDLRLPWHKAMVGTMGPNDIMQGEYDYNPFAYDVGTVGVVFTQSYQHHAKDIPLLAPLFDMLVTKDINRRFTADEALRFLDEEVIAKSTEEQLSISERPGHLDEELASYEEYDRWKDLPAEFQQEWAAYREPLGVSWTTRILRTLVLSEFIPAHTVPNIRWFFFKSMSIPRAFVTCLIGLFTHSPSRS